MCFKIAWAQYNEREICVFKSKPRLTSELRKQQYTVTLFDRNNLAHVIYSSLANVQFFALFCFEFEGNFQVQAPGGLYLGLYLEGRFIGGFLVLRLWGANIHVFGRAYPWRGLFWEFYGSPSIKSQICNIVSLCVQSNANCSWKYLYVFCFYNLSHVLGCR